MKQFNVNKLFVIQARLLFYIKCICTYLPSAVVKNGVMYREKREEKREKGTSKDDGQDAPRSPRKRRRLKRRKSQEANGAEAEASNDDTR